MSKFHIIKTFIVILLASFLISSCSWITGSNQTKTAQTPQPFVCKSFTSDEQIEDIKFRIRQIVLAKIKECSIKEGSIKEGDKGKTYLGTFNGSGRELQEIDSFGWGYGAEDETLISKNECDNNVRYKRKVVFFSEGKGYRIYDRKNGGWGDWKKYPQTTFVFTVKEGLEFGSDFESRYFPIKDDFCEAVDKGKNLESFFESTLEFEFLLNQKRDGEATRKACSLDLEKRPDAINKLCNTADIVSECVKNKTTECEAKDREKRISALKNVCSFKNDSERVSAIKEACSTSKTPEECYSKAEESCQKLYEKQQEIETKKEQSKEEAQNKIDTLASNSSCSIGSVGYLNKNYKLSSSERNTFAIWFKGTKLKIIGEPINLNANKSSKTQYEVEIFESENSCKNFGKTSAKEACATKKTGFVNASAINCQ